MKRTLVSVFALIIIAAATVIYFRSALLKEPDTPPSRQASTTQPPSNTSSSPPSPILNETDEGLTDPHSDRPHIFTLGDFDIEVQFEDEELPPAGKRVIASDLNLVYDHLELDQLIERPVAPGGQLVRQISFAGKGRYWPDQLDEFGTIIGTESTQRLLVGPETSDHYRTAMEFTKSYSKEIKQLPKSLNNIHSLAQSSDLEVSDAKSAFILNTPTARQLKDDDFVKNLHALKGGKIRPPSILDYRLLTLGETEYLAAETVLLYADQGSIRHAERINVAFEGGSWKLLF